MVTLRWAGLVAVMAFALAACGSSGGNGGSEANDAACTGVDCVRDEEPPPAPLICGGLQGTTCPAGYRCVDDPADACDPATGADCAGVCLLGEQLASCGGRNEQPCPIGYLCVDDPSDACPGGPAVDCPGICTPEPADGCASDADCPELDAPCSLCADGSLSCPQSICNEGECTVVVKSCPGPLGCGGIGGMPCAPGFECVDDPAGECDPAAGADCIGICVPEREPPSCELAGQPCPPGFECVDDPTDDCEPDASGAGCRGVCEPSRQDDCRSDEDCPPLRAPCSVCPDGAAACPRSYCEQGRCNVSLPTCPPPIVCSDAADSCKPDELCVDDPNDRCEPGQGDACPGVCVPKEMPRPCGGLVGATCPAGYQCADDPTDDCEPDASGTGCPGVCERASVPECRADDECPRILAPCRACPDGSFACALPSCRDGKCDIAFEACPDPAFCGGIAGFPCAPGYTCIDDPADDCDPQRGGADCGGICVREDQPRPCGGLAGDTCPEGYECADDPADECDPSTGGADCPGICRHAPNPECASDADCPAVGAPCVLCPDGTAACPLSFCENGVCRVLFETCEDR